MVAGPAHGGNESYLHGPLVPSEQTTEEPAGTTTVVLSGGGGLLLLMQPDSATSMHTEANTIFIYVSP
jgi:hypothetical protein